MSDSQLTPEKQEALNSAFRGANSLVFLLVYLVLTVLPVVWLYEKMTGWMQVLGLILLSLFTAFILMLFLSGIIKLMLKRLFILLSPDYRQLFQGERR